jgi:prepilin-type N-terminal cleavage/methylation domain-containing protein
MSHYNAHKSNSGFTLVELLITLVVIGVIAAITAPNFLGLLGRNRVNDTALQVEGALKEAQRQAIRKGKRCQIDINTTSKTISNPATNGCLLNVRNLNNSVQLNSNLQSISFSGKGNITGGTITTPVLVTPVLVVSMPNRTTQNKCVVFNGLFGVMRSGDYTTALGAGDIPVPTSCQ